MTGFVVRRFSKPLFLVRLGLNCLLNCLSRPPAADVIALGLPELFEPTKGAVYGVTDGASTVLCAALFVRMFLQVSLMRLGHGCPVETPQLPVEPLLHRAETV